MKLMNLAMFGIAVASLAVSQSYAVEIDPALEEAIRVKAGETLIDPYSAVFTFNVVTEMGEGLGGKICGSVNAKNVFGGFSGGRFFYAGYVKIDEGYIVIAFTTIDVPYSEALARGKICS